MAQGLHDGLATGERTVIRRVAFEQDASTWRELGERSAVAALQQCPWWAAPLEPLGVRTAAIGIWREERLVGGALFRCLPTPCFPASIAECVRGPILLEWRPEWAEGVVTAIERLAREHRSLEVSLGGCGNQAAHADLLAAFRSRGAALSLTKGPVDAVVPLEGADPAQLLARMSEGTRRNIRKGEKAGLRIVRLSTPQELRRAHESWLATAKRKGFSDVRPWPYLQPVVERCLREGLGAVLASVKDDELLASIFVTFMGGRGSYLYGGFFDGAQRHSPNHVLHLAALRLCLERGLKAYDLGKLPGGGCPEAHPLDRFKLGFGAVPQPQLDSVVWSRRPLLSRAGRWLRRRRLGRLLVASVRRRLLDGAAAD